MSEIWPFDVQQRLVFAPKESIRPFKCILLMPFESRFNQVADLIHATVEMVFDGLRKDFQVQAPHVERLDWVVSTGVIQDQLWRRVAAADLVFCDLTGHNPNVMFEAGVCAAWLPVQKVIFIRDYFFKLQAPFDLAPVRYLEYSLTSEGVPGFVYKIEKHVREAVVAFPDDLGSPPFVTFPLDIDFRGNRDDLRLYTPYLAHRRAIDDTLEFGSVINYAQSWATVGKEPLSTFEVQFSARFCLPIRGDRSINLGLRSHHYYAPYGHIFYLNADGKVVLTQPDDSKPNGYEDLVLREATEIDQQAFHDFRARFSAEVLEVEVDGFSRTFDVAKMPKVLGPGLIRLQSYGGWMALKRIRVTMI